MRPYPVSPPLVILRQALSLTSVLIASTCVLMGIKPRGFLEHPIKTPSDSEGRSGRGLGTPPNGIVTRNALCCPACSKSQTM